MVPGMTHGAIIPSVVNPAIKVCVPHLPNGADPYDVCLSGFGPSGASCWFLSQFRPLPDGRLRSNLPKRNEHQPVGFPTHTWLAVVNPFASGVTNLGAQPLLYYQSLFYMRNPTEPKPGGLTKAVQTHHGVMTEHWPIPVEKYPALPALYPSEIQYGPKVCQQFRPVYPVVSGSNGLGGHDPPKPGSLSWHSRQKHTLPPGRNCLQINNQTAAPEDLVNTICPCATF